ncbi:hypothetical protein PR001_g31291 [Phytophthora rubi]|uniref:Uncharacterized protein n=1 Tax=Phytophthora rubi TaxID=129364 RepID=A0A6A3GJV2_9STRA|nr:hypothetical protein PR001_g31291 [Phytophthora rubi]
MNLIGNIAIFIPSASGYLRNTICTLQARVASGEGGAWRLSFLPCEGPVLVRMQVQMQDVYNAAGSVRDERMS